MAIYDETASSSAVASSSASAERLLDATGASSAIVFSSAVYERVADVVGASSAVVVSSAIAERIVEAIGASSAIVFGTATFSQIVDAVGASVAIAYGTARYDGEQRDAWVTNVDNGAVGQYHDFNFNSFATVDGRLFACGDSGVFEIKGDTDDGAAIPFFIASGTIRQEIGLLRPAKAYLVGQIPPGIEFYLIDEDDERYHYSAPATDGRFDTSALPLGKGMRVRHLRYGLCGLVDEPFELSSLTIRTADSRRNV